MSTGPRERSPGDEFTVVGPTLAADLLVVTEAVLCAGPAGSCEPWARYLRAAAAELRGSDVSQLSYRRRRRGFSCPAPRQRGLQVGAVTHEFSRAAVLQTPARIESPAFGLFADALECSRTDTSSSAPQNPPGAPRTGGLSLLLPVSANISAPWRQPPAPAHCTPNSGKLPAASTLSSDWGDCPNPPRESIFLQSPFASGAAMPSGTVTSSPPVGAAAAPGPASFKEISLGPATSGISSSNRSGEVTGIGLLNSQSSQMSTMTAPKSPATGLYQMAPAPQPRRERRPRASPGDAGIQMFKLPPTPDRVRFQLPVAAACRTGASGGVLRSPTHRRGDDDRLADNLSIPLTTSVVFGNSFCVSRQSVASVASREARSVPDPTQSPKGEDSESS
eukprot:Hpha_TRINITY_DN15746_c1_g1::TRINITY_DN15746_c1_g1_i1::g.39807::m.39807